MKNIPILFLYFCCLNALLSCSTSDLNNIPVENNVSSENDATNTNDSATLRILSLGDSYTIGQSVCGTCNFPLQLKNSLTANLNNTTFEVDIVAQTGWTTTSLKNAVNTQVNYFNYNLVTLLIGVNNQFQNKPFAIYEVEFPELLDKAIEYASGNKDRVIVVSIPDYAFTPFGNQNPQISSEIDAYNAFAENYCSQNNITFVNITDITRRGIIQPNLVASDGLHPSEVAYQLFVERLLPFAINIVTD